MVLSSHTVLVAIGWIGASTYVLAYTLLSIGRLPANTNRYHLLNALGGLCLVIHSSHNNDLPDMAVNLVWIIIAAGSMLRITMTRKKQIRLVH